MDNTPTVYDDAAIAAREAETRKAQIEADSQLPPDPEAILEVRHLRKCFPIEKTITGKVTRDLVAVDDVSFKLMPGETLGIVGGQTVVGLQHFHPAGSAVGEGTKGGIPGSFCIVTP